MISMQVIARTDRPDLAIQDADFAAKV